jgi:murein L,D-transpeptidase YcbB/YkuD
MLAVAWIAVAAGLAMPSPRPAEGPRAAVAAHDPVARAIRAALDDQDVSLVRAYAQRGYRPLWTGSADRGRTSQAMALLNAAGDHGVAADVYLTPELTRALAQARSGGPAERARADIGLTRAFAAFVADVHRPASGMVYADPQVRPHVPDAAEVVARLGAPGADPAALVAMNPEYEGLRAALSAARARGDGALAETLRRNLVRARGLPADLGREHVVVDVAVQGLEVWRGGRMVEQMPVVVGTAEHPTPAMAGVLRFLVLKPYWHVPPDLAAARVAPAVLRDGPAELARRGLEVVSDFSPTAAPLDPASVDWSAVAAGRIKVYLRERPGPRNMMGQVKFIFPNAMGVYLHDTPLRGDFAAAQRTASAGCVRLFDAPRLARALAGDKAAPAAAVGPEQIVTLPRPIPIYLIYLTARATPPGLSLRRDIYGLDGASP